MHDMLRWFASSQIRNVACLGGNLVTASPISDMNPMLAAMGGKLIISSIGDDKKTIYSREVAVGDFFLKYRTVDLKPTELVERIEVPIAHEIFEYIQPFKQARRREDDISIVSSGMRIRLVPDGDKWMIKDAAIAFGGMAPTTVLASKTADVLIGNEFCNETFVKAREVALEELRLPYTVPGGQAAFRMTLVASFLHKFYLSVVADLKQDVDKVKLNPSLSRVSFDQLPPTPTIDENELSGLQTFVDAKKPSITGMQKYPPPKVAKGLEDKKYPEAKAAAAVAAGKDGTVGKASPHQSGPLHCTGEALYTDDIPLPPSTLEASLVLSSVCGGILKAMDTKPALDVPGVFAVYTYEDIVAIGGDNKLGPIVNDENLFLPMGEKVQTVGQVLGIVVAETLESAELGARLVKVEYGETTEKVIVSIEDAIEAKSFYEFACHTMERGDLSVIESLADKSDVQSAPAVGDIVKVSGTFRCPGQEHFYLETNSSLVVPSESDTNLTIYASTQAATKTQEHCASVTGTPASKVVVRMKRMGGGFGGKESRSVFVSCAAALAAKISCRPVRLTLARDIDMSITGGRHAFVAHYSASAVITEEGAKLHAFDVKLYSNGGWEFDLSGPVMDRALYHVDGCYYWPNFRAVGNVCKTAQPNHTAYRGFGGPQGIAVCEHVVEHLSVACRVPYDVMRRSNFYKNGDSVPFGMIMGEGFSGKWNIPTMWDRLYADCEVTARRAGIDEFNSKHKWLKRGLAIVPTKFGIAFTAKYMNQG
jgi:xanthine dehydrogenase/oxidase